MTTTTTITNSNNHDLINLLALSATAGTLRRVYDASGNDTIRELRNCLQSDARALAKLADCADRATTLEINDNTGLYNTIVIDESANAAVNTMINDDTITDAYDLYMTAYEYLWQEMIVNDRACDDIVTITNKDGTTKERTIYQCACMAVRREIYANKSIDSTGKYLYIEDMRSGADDNGADALDREYIRLGKYYDLGGACHSDDINSSIDGIYSADHETVDSTNALMASLNLTDRQALVLHYRRQGISVSAIADKLNVSQQAISKTLVQVQEKVKAQHPELVRSYNSKRKA